jgi:hypothetical protein
MADKSLTCARITVAGAIAAALLALAPAAHAQQQPNRSGCVTRFHNGKPYIFCVSKKRAWRRAPTTGTAPTAAPAAPAAPRRYETVVPPSAPAAPRRYETVVPPSAPAAPMTSSGPRAAPSPPPPPATAGAPRDGGAAAGAAAAPATAAPSRSIAAGAAPARVRAVRALIEPAEMPPREVAGYGIVAFTTRPMANDIERYKLICEAYKATLMAQSELPANTPLSEQMITYWPIADKSPEAQRGDCMHLVSNYALRLGLDAIQDADKQAEGLASRRGPFLIAWAPSESRFKPDALVLVMDLSALDSARSFTEVFQDWRQHITDKPELWRRGGFDVEAVRRVIHDTFDRFGDGLLRLISSKS